MFDRYGIAVMGERRHARRFAALENYLRMEYGATSGMDRYIAQANHDASTHSGLWAFLAGIARVVSRPSTRASPPGTVRPALSGECAGEHASLSAPS